MSRCIQTALVVYALRKVRGAPQFRPVRLFALERSKQDLAKLQEIGFPRRGWTPRKPDLASRLRLNEAEEFSRARRAPRHRLRPQAAA
jgi:hypothetical protein